jgi:hypothetical protein
MIINLKNIDGVHFFGDFLDKFQKNYIKVKKIVLINIQQLLTDRGLAYWYKDDGYKSVKGFYICTEYFSLNEIELLIL